jgi:rare lipoprotein A
MTILGRIAAAGLALAVQPAGGAEMYGNASWFGREVEDNIMADGTRFSRHEVLCASWFYPFGTQLSVTNLSNGKSVVVTVRDRGPAWRLVRDPHHRIIDLSEAAFAKIADIKTGIIPVRVSKIEKINVPIIEAPPVGHRHSLSSL